MVRNNVVYIENNVGGGAIWRLNRVLRNGSASMSVKPEWERKGKKNSEECELLDEKWPSRDVFSMRPPAWQVLLWAM
jgi:hypothetical protein